MSRIVVNLTGSFVQSSSRFTIVFTSRACSHYQVKLVRPRTRRKPTQDKTWRAGSRQYRWRRAPKQAGTGTQTAPLPPRRRQQTTSKPARFTVCRAHSAAETMSRAAAALGQLAATHGMLPRPDRAEAAAAGGQRKHASAPMPRASSYCSSPPRSGAPSLDDGRQVNEERPRFGPTSAEADEVAGSRRAELPRPEAERTFSSENGEHVASRHISGVKAQRAKGIEHPGWMHFILRSQLALRAQIRS